MKGAKLTVASLIAGRCPLSLSLLLCQLEVDYNLNDASLTWLVSGRHNKCQVNEYFIAIHLKGVYGKGGGVWEAERNWLPAVCIFGLYSTISSQWEHRSACQAKTKRKN